MKRKVAIARFQFEIDAFETIALQAALQSFSLDAAFVETPRPCWMLKGA
jgi:hypothetical protein